MFSSAQTISQFVCNSFTSERMKSLVIANSTPPWLLVLLFGGLSFLKTLNICVGKNSVDGIVLSNHVSVPIIMSGFAESIISCHSCFYRLEMYRSFYLTLLCFVFCFALTFV